jgi:hypothetical protein
MTLEGVKAKYGEHWEKAAPPPPPPGVVPPKVEGITPPLPAAKADAKPASFAEAPTTVPSPVDPLTQTLARAGDVVLADWMQAIAAMVIASDTPEQLRDRLVKAYGDLPTEQLTEVMAMAFAAAELAGMAKVATEAGQGA